uniref:ATP synthase complex subunit 8 n=1 Tax=Hynobius quelpaertensis TaxID=113393 RepID=A9XF50_9AMPH|nr:ATP synthase F0 subunit 8 [Hynobius quelpaertensis]ABM45924.1 ATPase subunit 8 [Hynobius quelpaertensis]ADG22954.1 ATP synthase F0 subunit 8 [Hynobius quelpaertensis]
MPQLNPGPWFAIFLMSWVVFLLILTFKISNFNNLNEPTAQNKNVKKPESWSWPWI